MILTKSQGARLTTALHAARPDWPTNSIASILQTANTHGGLPAHDFDHALRAAITYATATGPLGYLKQTPAYLHEPSKFWDDTAPTNTRHQQVQAKDCEEHIGEPAHNCACCWSEIKTGQRPQQLLGKRTSPPAPNTPRPTKATKPALEPIQAQ